MTQKVSNKGVDKFSDFVVNKYNEEIYSAVLYGMCRAANIKFDKRLNYSDFENVIDVLIELEVSKIEESIKFVLSTKIQRLLRSQYHSILLTKLIIWLLILTIPFIEFIVYKVWFEKILIKRDSK